MATVLPQEDGALLERKTPSILKALALVENKAFVATTATTILFIIFTAITALKNRTEFTT